LSLFIDVQIRRIIKYCVNAPKRFLPKVKHLHGRIITEKKKVEGFEQEMGQSVCKKYRHLVP
jgi:hypothetical protein